MMATVLVVSEESEPLKVGVGIKQGCAVASVLFNIHLEAAIFLFAQRNEDEHSIYLTCKPDSSLFNLNHLKTTPTSNTSVSQSSSLLTIVLLWHIAWRICSTPSR